MPGEFDFIRRFLHHFPKARVPVGPGDDCAVLAPSRGALCVTTDAVVEDVHFTRAGFSPADIGHKALAVNLSDVAAMGATPRWFVCALALPRDFPAAHLSGIARGMAALAREHRVDLVGGNFTSARELSVTITATGELSRPPLTRSGARPGDWLYVSGTLGDARLGLAHLKAGLKRGAAVRRQRRPVPRVALGQLASRFASAALDVSDGLAQDLGHLCTASGVRAVVELARLPMSAAVRRELGPEGALAGGEDYELLLAVAPGRGRAFERACARGGHVVTRVGVLSEGAGWVIHDEAGRAVRRPGGFDHFR
ncbi:thiamine-phosphate kinase [Myxococcus llanfairpwllgwyngyllgogerychwyrndrobwllllantysiliogogogochensis]|uniref:Thiamine-monophosphate kinase n=1 Tax=Myxococcus llanfairpwllgwyngyllgogerychwyrndrobwllllantysiliogogogochensis TaxID=2590453 RepID=A0A540X507_9BACT|nr:MULTISPECIES: thiamine-phosphate kinase [Myxococcus]NTX34447.1 thiamine-phosphate kinase [Myxococcus sp. CA033]TQF16328.1 thiamine-phosphate kinase [Myxococcus llanfairpwllgwyngyllgogerychwyrndrobwllllantysiliogogogochensis]